MTSVHSSSLIGAQAYASQLRRQYSQEETARAAVQGIRGVERATRETHRPAVALDGPHKESPKQTFAAALKTEAAAGNPTLGEITEHQNPPAQPLYSTARRESPNPNATLRHTRPGTHLNITV